MAKFSLAVLAIVLQLISGISSRPDNFLLSNEQNTIHRNFSAEWKEVINSEKNPCEEFNAFVCSNNKFIDHKLSGTVEEQLRSIFRAKPELMTKTEEKYLKYSNIESFRPEQIEEFIKLFKFENSIGNWPAFEENWDDSKFNLPLAITEMNSYDSPAVFSQSFEFHPVKSFLKIKPEIINLENYQGTLQYIFKQLKIKNPEEIFTDTALFETTYKEAAESVTSTNNKEIKFSELKDFIPEVDWDKQTEVLFGENLPDNYPVLLVSHEKLKKIYSAVSKLNPKVIANYFFCVFVSHASGVIIEPRKYFMPIAKQAYLKHVLNENTKEIVKGIYATMVQILQEKNILYESNDHYTAEEIVKFIDSMFELSNKDDLAKEFQAISTDYDELIVNHYRLIQLERKRSTKPFFKPNNNLEIVFKTKIAHSLAFDVAPLIGQPSPLFFGGISMAFLIDTFEDLSKDPFVFSAKRKECFANKIPDFNESSLRMLFTIQLIPKMFEEWITNYPDVVTEENKMLHEYDLNAEKLLVTWLEKLNCEGNIIIAALASTEEFPRIYDCPAGSKMNPVVKCTLW